MPKMTFELVEVTKNKSFCDETKIPKMGSLFFNHELTPTDNHTIIKHYVEFVWLNGEVSKEILAFTSQVFSGLLAFHSSKPTIFGTEKSKVSF
ncbi:hypothetical protein Hs30E_17560 [Lactococcus hodotermopsidis]|uniref:Uncharacterized protein n=1 Tax=Pseudolactococcus hodotermopsidis TaxID=2709157 RepID=A0A6A0BES5_9LACT|nr:hypothetical protein [Lactococcus hodotermopsidis]GFH43205.1 hypothetical protein Hs30E_17560 [Lactococcus hodotermopsidis]